jgi:integrase
MARIFQDTREVRTLGKSKAPWWVEWRVNGNRRSQKVGTRKQAKEIAALKEAEKLQRRNGLIVDTTWAEFVARYKQDVLPLMRSARSREVATEVLDRFGKYSKPLYVGGIDAATLDRYAAKRMRDRGRKVGDTLSPQTVRKDLRTIAAALGKAVEWNCLAAVPPLPKVATFDADKRFVTVEHFEAMLSILDPQNENHFVPKMAPNPRAPFTPAEWWRALLVTLWATGMRIGAVLSLRWEDVDLDAGTAISRAKHNKAKKDQRVHIAAVVNWLRPLKGFDPRVFPWDWDKTALYTHFRKLQEAAGVHLHCPGDHEHTPACHVYGFHDFRRAHATFNYGRVSDRDLQQQMGHASFSTTQRYIKYAEGHKEKAYNALIPDAMKAASAAG